MRKPKRKSSKARPAKKPKRVAAASLNELEASMLFRERLGKWFVALKKNIRAMTGPSLTIALEQAGVHVPNGASETWRRHRLAYALQEEYRAKHGVDTPESVLDRIKELDGLGGKMPSWSVDIFTGERPKEAVAMAAKRSGKAEKVKKKTIGGFMVDLLRQKVVPPNAEIVDIVKAEFPDSAFSGSHVSWYKGAFMAGKLPGQVKGEKINQPEIRVKKDGDGEAAAPKKVSKKASKKVAKKKVAKKKTSKKAPKRKAVATA